MDRLDVTQTEIAPCKKQTKQLPSFLKLHRNSTDTQTFSVCMPLFLFPSSMARLFNEETNLAFLFSSGKFSLAHLPVCPILNNTKRQRERRWFVSTYRIFPLIFTKSKSSRACVDLQNPTVGTEISGSVCPSWSQRMSKQRSHPTDPGFLQAMPFPLQSLELSRMSSCLGSGMSHKYFFKEFWEEERCVLSASYPGTSSALAGVCTLSLWPSA